MKRLPAHLISFCCLVLFPLVVSAPKLSAQESEDAGTEEEHGFELSGYGEMLYQHFDFGPDRKSDPNGAPADSRSVVSLPRAVFELEYHFRPDLYLETEIEFEYGGTGSAMELEYEEFGEYEHEVEKGGEIVLEEIHITKEFFPELSLRLGHFILPVGLLNTAHDPDDYFTTIRPESESGIIPVTWHETGIEAFGDVAGFSYRLQLVNGLDATGFTSERWVTEGHQTKFEVAQATDMAVVGALEYKGIDGLRVGGSVYHGNSTGNRPKEDMEGIDGNVTIFDGHVAYERGPLTARGVFLRGSLQNADIISQKNLRTSKNLQVPRTPVASAAQAWAAEAGYDVFSFILPQSGYRLYPFVRYEYYNAMEETTGDVFADPRFERTVATAGLNFFLNDNVVLKADYSHREFGRENYNSENTIGFSLGYHGKFFETGD